MGAGDHHRLVRLIRSANLASLALGLLKFKLLAGNSKSLQLVGRIGFCLPSAYRIVGSEASKLNLLTCGSKNSTERNVLNSIS